MCLDKLYFPDRKKVFQMLNMFTMWHWLEKILSNVLLGSLVILKSSNPSLALPPSGSSDQIWCGEYGDPYRPQLSILVGIPETKYIPCSSNVFLFKDKYVLVTLTTSKNLEMQKLTLFITMINSDFFAKSHDWLYLLFRNKRTQN